MPLPVVRSSVQPLLLCHLRAKTSSLVINEKRFLKETMTFYKVCDVRSLGKRGLNMVLIICLYRLFTRNERNCLIHSIQKHFAPLLL